MKKLILPMLLAAVAGGASAVEPMWVRDVKLSPDGGRVAFVYKGAIYTVPSAGGKAVRLTSGEHYDCTPVWSPDGKRIAFSSDRNGGTDIYIMNDDGSAPRRLTWNSAAETPEAFTADGKSVIFSAMIQDPASSVLAPVRVNSELYTVPVDGGRIEQLLATPAAHVSAVPGTDMFVFEDVKGNEDEWRKHHTSSVTRDIWTWSPSGGKFSNLTSRAGEDREPAPSADGKTVYFLSERDGGSFNVYSMPIDGKGETRKLTDFTTHPVRFLSAGTNGLLAFTYNGELFTMKPGGKPVKLPVDVTDTDSEGESTVRFSRADESAVSPDGSQVAFTNRGEVFVTSVKYPSTKQITHTAAGEGQLSWGKKGRDLYYTSRRSGRQEIYHASIVRTEDPNFSNATLINEEPLFPSDGVERNNPNVSPDGKKLAFVENRNTLKVMDLATKKVTTLTQTPLNNYRGESFGMMWSPDSRWLAVEVMDPLHEPYSDIALINAADGEQIRLTRTGYFDQQPRWSDDGKAILFASERYGMRNHASWGSENDVMMVFLTKDAYDRYRLSEEDFALLKEVEKEQKKSAAAKDEKNDGKKKGKKGKGDKSNETAKEEDNLVKIDREGIADRIVRLTPNSSRLADFVLSKDGETLYYLSAFEGGYDLWKKDLRKGDVSLVKKLDSGHVGIQTDNDGNIFLAGSSVRKFDPKSKELKNVSLAGSMKLDLAKEREAMLDYVATEARERFYLPEMPVDWDMYVENYRRFLPHINHNHDFAELLSELLGELNVSHSGGRYYGPGAVDVTASLGLLFDWNYNGDGLKVSEIVAGGPFDRATTRLKAGDVVTAINGNPVKGGEDWTPLLNNTLKKKTLVTVSHPASGETWDEVVLPVSSAVMGELLYNRWVKGREAAVDSLSGGRLGYVHLRSMSDDSFRKVYAKLLGEYMGKEGIVIDTRWNGGGRLHEDIEVLFSGEKYLTQEIHGRKSSEMPSRRWNKPSVMVIGEANYSNAHGTPWVYKHKKMGKLVGMPVPGTMSSVNWIDLQDPSLLFGVPVVAFRTNDGTVLENTQLEPDIKVANAPEDVVRGIDAQIEAAVRSLLNDIDGK
ncbi:MAG: PDZ domain-containing protein [Muribaculaceae bacterium]|nr:PDZ domain-containing protein [Muribaculaceae bacterium]